MTRSARVGENAENSPMFEECYDEESHDEAKGPFESGDFEENIKMVRCMMQMRC